MCGISSKTRAVRGLVYIIFEQPSYFKKKFRIKKVGFILFIYSFIYYDLSDILLIKLFECGFSYPFDNKIYCNCKK